VNRILSRIQTLWSTQEPARRLQLAVAVAATAAILLAVGVWSASPSWTPVLSGRAYDELQNAAGVLHNAGVEARIRGGGLEVREGEAGAARAALAGYDNLPSITDAAELPMGLTPTAQTWAFAQAKQGDLARLINNIAGVASSSVHIVPRREGLFIDDVEPARASVFVKMRPGRKLDGQAVRGIVGMVANAVEGMTADWVAVTDDQGNVLADGSGNGAAGSEVPGELLAYRAELERSYERNVRRALIPVLGMDGGFSVTASVDVDLTSSETVSKRVDPEVQALLSEQIEESNSTREQPGGVPGVDANLPERPTAGAKGVNRQESNSTTANYAYPTIDEVSRRPAGEIQRVSVGVQVDAARVGALAEASGVDVKVIQDQIEEAVQTAVGMDETRNDNITVQFIPFSAVDATDEVQSIPTATTVQTSMPYAVAALAIALAFWFVIRPLMSGLLKSPAPEVVAEPEEDAEDKQDNVVKLDEEAQLALRLRRLIDDFQPVDAAELSGLVAQQPQAAAKVLKMWQRKT